MLANMPLDPSVLDTAKHLKFIDVAFTGVDHIPMDLARARGIAVSNASGYATQAVAELCISFMIHLLRNVSQTEARCRAGGTKDGLVGRLLCGKTIGIVGAGAIGKRVAALCKAFGCRVIAYNRSQVTDPVFDAQVTLDELLTQADIVSLHCPLTPQTQGMIGAKRACQDEAAGPPDQHRARRGGRFRSPGTGAARRYDRWRSLVMSLRANRPCRPTIRCSMRRTPSSPRILRSPPQSPWNSAQISCLTTYMPGWTANRSMRSNRLPVLDA